VVTEAKNEVSFTLSSLSVRQVQGEVGNRKISDNSWICWSINFNFFI